MKDKIKQIVDMLVQITISGELIWKESNNNNEQRDYIRNMYSITEDGTKFEIAIKYTLVTDIWEIDKFPFLHIKSNTLPNGTYLVSNNIYDVCNLRDIVKNKYCSDMSPSIDYIKDKLDKIYKGISPSTYRDNKIDEIL